MIAKGKGIEATPVQIDRCCNRFINARAGAVQIPTNFLGSARLQDAVISCLVAGAAQIPTDLLGPARL
jgi:hypothetical protein